MPGVEQVVEVQGWPWPSKFLPLGGVAVIARNTGCGHQGRDALKIVWDDGPNANYDFGRLSRRAGSSGAQRPARSCATTATSKRR